MDSVIDMQLRQLKDELAQLSKFKLHSVGVVLENKPRTINDVLVCPIEILPLLNGELAAEEETVEHKGKNFYDEEYTVKVNARQGIRCKWLQLGSNRVTAPDVRRGERVFIYRFADSDEYYWKETGLDDHLRRLETVTYLFNANPDGLSDEPTDAKNAYTLEVSTHDKLITLQTTSLNGEPFEYTLQFNTNEGRVTLADNDGNYVEFNSAETSITMENRETTKIVLDKQNIFVYAPNNIDIEAVENIDVRCKNMTIKVGESYTKDVGDAITITSATYNLKTGTATIEADTVTVDSPTSTFTGQVSAGSISIAPGSKGGDGGLGISGDANIQGNVQLGGNMVVTGNITCKKLTSQDPISAPNV